MLRIVLAVAIGGGIGLAVGSVGKALGGQCPIACNPYVSTALGVVVALALAGSTVSLESLYGPNVLRIGSEAAYDELVAGEGKVALIEFYTPQCPACRRQAPVISEMADRFAGRAAVAVVNARKASALAQRERMDALPTLVLYKDGRRAATLAGFKPEGELAALIEGPAEQGGGT